MNYRELLQKYKAGELPEEQRKQVRQDIEKQDAISEYLFDNEEMEFEEQVEQDGGQTTESTDGSVPKDGQNVNIAPASVDVRIRRPAACFTSSTASGNE